MSVLEILGFFSSLLAVWLTVKKNKWCWLWNIISAAIYLFYFFELKLIADSILQFFFIGMSIYGWINWNKNSKSANKGSKWVANRLSRKNSILLLFLASFLTFVLGFVLTQYTFASLPYLDSFCFSLSILATALAAYKYVENWMVWIITDSIYIGIYLWKDAYLTAVLYLIFIVMAILGMLEWKKQNKWVS